MFEIITQAHLTETNVVSTILLCQMYNTIYIYTITTSNDVLSALHIIYIIIYINYSVLCVCYHMYVHVPLYSHMNPYIHCSIIKSYYLIQMVSLHNTIVHHNCTYHSPVIQRHVFMYKKMLVSWGRSKRITHLQNYEYIISWACVSH